MKNPSKTIVFFGSGPVAAKSLESLKQSFKIEAVITKPSTVDEMSLVMGNDSKLFTVKNRSELDQIIKGGKFKSNIGVVVDFGIIISKRVIDSFELGIVNSHFSLLPQWRGADPIVFSILSGQKETGVSLMVINENLDEGDLLAQKAIDISDQPIEPDLTNRLISLSNSILGTYLPRYISGQLKAYPQKNNAKATYSRKLTKTDGIIDWHEPAVQIEREIRAFFTWPKSRTTLNGVELIIRRAEVITDLEGSPGDYKLGKNSLLVKCGQGGLSLKQVQPVNKNEMSIEAFLAGYRDKL